MKIKTSELTGKALDWAVAKCEGHMPLYKNAPHANLRNKLGNIWHLDELNYSTDWSQGGPIIQRERISIRHWTNVPVVHAYMPDSDWSSDGESALVAAMRCYVASKLGEECEVPDELA